MKIPPATYAEAMTWPDSAVWHAVVQKELDMIQDMRVHSITPLPASQKAIGSRFVFELKIDSQELIPKVRLVMKGFHQILGVDFGKIFAPVVKADILGLVH
jgi:hypothetical protein